MKLKNINLGLGLMALLALSSCADDKFSEYRTDMTKNLKEYQYLNNYEPLKKYVEDMKAAGKCNPDFKLGIALEAAEFNKQGLVYCLAGSNFTETVAGNAMKMASCVADDGRMNFDNVSEYVKKATDAGLSVYGHTLAWHAQQPNKYLKGLIADKVDPSAEVEKPDYELDCSTLSKYDWHEFPPSSSVTTEWNKDGAVVITNGKAIENHELQYWLVNGIQLKTGTKYKITFLCKAEGESPANIYFKLGDWGDNNPHKTFTIPVGGDYKEVSLELTPIIDSNGLFFQHGQFVGKIYWKSIKITHSEAPSTEIPVSVAHLTFDDGQNLGGWNMDNKPKIVNGVCEVGNNAAKANPWDAQVCYDKEGFTFENGTTYHLKMKIKGSVDGEFGALFQNPDGYKGCGDFPTIKVTTDWKEVDKTTTCNGDNALRLLLNIGKYVGTLYIDDFEVYYTKPSNTPSRTDEEMQHILTAVLQNWIYGIMKATEGKVKAWDVVNEALSGEDKDGDGKFDLQSAKRGNVKPDDAKNSFYWQDYLGDLDYVRTAVAAARKGFADAGGTPEDLKLFINDYNLESDWDQNGKLKSLIQWIKDWEADGVTKIDGIGSQMHISCYGNPQTQESKKNAIENMLKLMAESGKLVRISELDMGYVDANGKEVKTADMTEEQHKEMRALYEFVVKKYLEIVPKEQQWGICQWCATDSPANSGWRPGLPVGLWDLDYYRKHTYGGFAAGLGAPEYWNNAK